MRKYSLTVSYRLRFSTVNPRGHRGRQAPAVADRHCAEREHQQPHLPSNSSADGPGAAQRPWASANKSSLATIFANPIYRGPKIFNRETRVEGEHGRKRRRNSGGVAVEAAVPLREAHAASSGLGAAPLRAAIEALASRARIQLEGQPGSPGHAGTRPAMTLTARELEVLALVAAGHTNREIGDRLFISEKTVSVHVTYAMDKLGALSRYEAAATATRTGLLDPAEVP